VPSRCRRLRPDPCPVRWCGPRRRRRVTRLDDVGGVRAPARHGRADRHGGGHLHRRAQPPGHRQAGQASRPGAAQADPDRSEHAERAHRPRAHRHPAQPHRHGHRAPDRGGDRGPRRDLERRPFAALDRPGGSRARGGVGLRRRPRRGRQHRVLREQDEVLALAAVLAGRDRRRRDHRGQPAPGPEVPHRPDRPDPQLPLPAPLAPRRHGTRPRVHEPGLPRRRGGHRPAGGQGGEDHRLVADPQRPHGRHPDVGPRRSRCQPPGARAAGQPHRPLHGLGPRGRSRRRPLRHQPDLHRPPPCTHDVRRRADPQRCGGQPRARPARAARRPRQRAQRASGPRLGGTHRSSGRGHGL
ncbi:MAG: hypothetical protein AVDCRST_MAG60-2103, partial [uncultured Nocardioides sp.]